MEDGFIEEEEPKKTTKTTPTSKKKDNSKAKRTPATKEQVVLPPKDEVILPPQRREEEEEEWAESVPSISNKRVVEDAPEVQKTTLRSMGWGKSTTGSSSTAILLQKEAEVAPKAPKGSVIAQCLSFT